MAQYCKMPMSDFEIVKQHIADLEAENALLRERWEKLKAWVGVDMIDYHDVKTVGKMGEAITRMMQQLEAPAREEK